jgi:ankyrin repeat protein
MKDNMVVKKYTLLLGILCFTAYGMGMHNEIDNPHCLDQMATEIKVLIIAFTSADNAEDIKENIKNLKLVNHDFLSILTDKLNILIKQCAEVFAVSPVKIALIIYTPKILDLLKAYINQNNNDDTIVQEAKKGSINNVALLLEAGANVNALDKDSASALLWALSIKSPEMINLLLDKGSTIDLKTGNGVAALALMQTWYPKGSVLEQTLLDRALNKDYIDHHHSKSNLLSCLSIISQNVSSLNTYGLAAYSRLLETLSDNSNYNSLKVWFHLDQAEQNQCTHLLKLTNRDIKLNTENGLDTAAGP